MYACDIPLGLFLFGTEDRLRVHLFFFFFFFFIMRQHELDLLPNVLSLDFCLVRDTVRPVWMTKYLAKACSLKCIP